MKGKKYTTEEKIRILRQADAGESIAEVCREHNLTQVSFHRWKKQFGQMEVKGTNLHVWFATTGKKNPAIKKAGQGTTS